jgi:hypothetical protein
MSLARCAAALALAAALAGCNPPLPPPTPGVNSLAPFPDGTVDTTHGAEGAQTSPR